MRYFINEKRKKGGGVMSNTHGNEQILQADLISLQDYLEQRHGPAMAQVLIDDLVTQGSVARAA